MTKIASQADALRVIREARLSAVGVSEHEKPKGSRRGTELVFEHLHGHGRIPSAFKIIDAIEFLSQSKPCVEGCINADEHAATDRVYHHAADCPNAPASEGGG